MNLSRWTAMLALASIITACAGAPDEQPKPELPAFESIPLDRSTRPDRSEDLSMDRLTVEYLAGTWCFARPDGEGERGIYVFDSDGSNQVGFAATDYRLELPGGLDTFRRRYDELVAMDRDRFVVKGGYYDYEFRRGSCS